MMRHYNPLRNELVRFVKQSAALKQKNSFRSSWRGGNSYTVVANFLWGGSKTTWTSAFGPHMSWCRLWNVKKPNKSNVDTKFHHSIVNFSRIEVFELCQGLSEGCVFYEPSSLVLLDSPFHKFYTSWYLLIIFHWCVNSNIVQQNQ